jgi:Na+-transporting NADH:ubiquinone oxidoreductase subunit NqrF
MNIQEILLAIGMFTGIVLALAVFIIAARAKLVSSGDVDDRDQRRAHHHRAGRRQAAADAG